MINAIVSICFSILITGMFDFNLKSDDNAKNFFHGIMFSLTWFGFSYVSYLILTILSNLAGV